MVEDLTVIFYRYNISSEWNNEADRIHWRKLFGSFGKVKNFTVDGGGLFGQLFDALQPGEEESQMELLPELQKLSYSGRRTSRDAFTQFIDARQKAGHPVTVVHI